jgi:hypothetical protein
MGDYNGIYVLEEKVKRGKDRVDIDKLEPEQTNAPAITGAICYKSASKTRTNELRGGGKSIVYQDPARPGVCAGVRAAQPGRLAQSNYLASYLNFFASTLNGSALTNGTGTNHYSFYLNVPRFIDHHMVTVFIMLEDAYWPEHLPLQASRTES